MTKTHSSQFIQNYPAEISSLSADTFLPVYQARFFTEYYDDRLFDEYEIEPLTNLNLAAVKRKSEYLAGRISAARALTHLGYVEFQVKPGVNREPLWPKGILGSISHSSGQVIACAVTQDEKIRYGVGIDIESVVSPPTARDIASHVISIEERRYLDSLPLSFPLALTLAFSAKESLYKALFPRHRRYMDFSDVQIVGFDSHSIRLILLSLDLLAQIPITTFDVHYSIRGSHIITFVAI